MMNTTEQPAELSAEDRLRAEEKYRTMLHDAGTTAEDVAELIEALGMKPFDYVSDANAIRQWDEAADKADRLRAELLQGIAALNGAEPGVGLIGVRSRLANQTRLMRGLKSNFPRVLGDGVECPPEPGPLPGDTVASSPRDARLLQPGDKHPLESVRTVAPPTGPPCPTRLPGVHDFGYGVGRTFNPPGVR